MINKYKKLISLLLVICMLSSLSTTIFATTDYTQGTQVTYNPADPDGIPNSGDEVDLEAYTITVPANLKPGTGGTVTLHGAWPSNRIVNVTADKSVELTNSINTSNKKTLTVTFAGISEAGSNTEAQTFTETVSVSAISNALFGTWSGHFSYNVDISTIRASVDVVAKDKNGVDLNATAQEIVDEEKDNLLDKLEESGLVNNSDDVDALIEVESDDFDDLAETTFDVSNIAQEGDKVVILHFNEETQEWEFVAEETVDANGKVTADFESYSPVAFVVIKSDGTTEVIAPHGVYFNQPYQMTIEDDGYQILYEYVFYKDGSATMWYSVVEEGVYSGAYIPEGTCTYTKEILNLDGTELTISRDGKTIGDGEMFMHLNPVTISTIKYGASYENIEIPTKYVFGTDGSLKGYEDGELVGEFPAGSVTVNEHLATIAIGDDAMVCPIYPDGTRVMLGDEMVVAVKCTHENTEIKDIAPTCGVDGMSDAEVCVDCGAIVKDGTIVPATGIHEQTMIVNEKVATCNKEGYTGDEICVNCEAIVKNGTVVPLTGIHEQTILANAVVATCGISGYTGDQICDCCGIIIVQGEIIPATGNHKNTSIKNVKNVFCDKDGYTGDMYCNDCNTIIMVGEIIRANGVHSFDKNNVCSKCGAWKVPDGGTYVSANITYNSGDIVYGINDGDIYKFGNYEYRYNYHYSVSGSTWRKDTSQSGWGVKCLNNVSDPGSILESINSTPVTTMTYTFYQCSNLQVAPSIPNSVTSMSNTFSGCISLTDEGMPLIPDSVTSMEYTFSQCDALIDLSNFTIPNSVTSMHDTFFHCSSLVVAPTIPSSVKELSFTFYNCESLTTVEIPDTVTVIGQSTFASCTSLTNIEIPASVERIVMYAFYGCKNLTSISFEGTIDQWEAISKSSGWESAAIKEIICTDGTIIPS